jgi:RimJ/RimL family protein N-acetyltransferase
MEIKKLLVSDLTQDYIDTLNDDEYMRFSRNKGKVHTIKSQREYISSFGSADIDPIPLLFGIFEDGKLEGTLTAYFDKTSLTANIGILIFKHASSRGLGKRSLIQFSRWVKARFPTYFIELGTEIENLGMIKIALSSGYEQVEGKVPSTYQFRYRSQASETPEFSLDSFEAPGLFFGTDTGGVENLLEYFLKMECRGSLVIRGSGVSVAEYYKVKYLETIQGNLNDYKSLFYSTGADSLANLDLEKSFQALNSPRICVLDHWINYEQRFNINPDYLPTHFITSNDFAFITASKTFPTSKVLLLPDYRLERLLNLMKIDFQRINPFVLVILEPERPALEGLGGITILDQLKAVEMGKLKAFEMGVSQVLVRLHPVMRNNEHLSVKLAVDPMVMISKNIRIEDDLISCCAVVGLSSSILYATSKLGLPTYTVLGFSKDSWMGQTSNIVVLKE